MAQNREADVTGTESRASATELNEQHLISRIAEGDRRAFEALYRNYFPRLVKFLGRMTRSLALVEEIINDTMLTVWQKAFSFNGSCKVSTWIFAIAYRKALKGLRQMDEPLEQDNDEICLDESLNEPEQGVMHKELHASIEQALHALPIEQSAVIHLTYFHGMAYGEIAEIMDCPVNTVKTRMFHARRRLKTLLSYYVEAQG
ncbi:RNA polymerase sigma factor [Undibacterium terreum]|uniref:RNA polymerase sigma factor n=1 Tax=Undibacterium terreum TaxID=1224302 RepID=A0A916V0X5_9BURK|nr:sigma-70 family RNA polymerase sigma factor [Undibacterium terreum]GGD02001.1 RNA polymerase sigma factor [Undibacterium terreum]